MASKPYVELTWGGDATGLQRAMERVGDQSKEMASQFDSSASRMRSSAAGIGNGVAEAVDVSERRFQGFGDTIEGTGDIMQGFKDGNVVQMARGFADLAGGITDFVVPALKSLGTRIGTMIGLTGAQTAATTGATGAQWSLNAALAANPIGVVIAAVAALVAAVVILVKNWDTVKSALGAVWDWMKSAATSVKNWVVSQFEGILNWVKDLPGKLMGAASAVKDAVLWPYKTAFNAIASLWNNTVGKLEFKVPSWVPGIGGKGWEMPDIPRFAEGGQINGLGIVGEEGPELFAGRGTIIPNHALGGTNVTVVVQGSVVTERQLVDAVHSGLLQKQRQSGNLGIYAA